MSTPIPNFQDPTLFWNVHPANKPNYTRLTINLLKSLSQTFAGKISRLTRDSSKKNDIAFPSTFPLHVIPVLKQFPVFLQCYTIIGLSLCSNKSPYFGCAMQLLFYLRAQTSNRCSTPVLKQVPVFLLCNATSGADCLELGSSINKRLFPVTSSRGFNCWHLAGRSCCSIWLYSWVVILLSLPG